MSAQLMDISRIRLVRVCKCWFPYILGSLPAAHNVKYCLAPPRVSGWFVQRRTSQQTAWVVSQRITKAHCEADVCLYVLLVLAFLRWVQRGRRTQEYYFCCCDWSCKHSVHITLSQYYKYALCCICAALYVSIEETGAMAWCTLRLSIFRSMDGYNGAMQGL